MFLLVHWFGGDMELQCCALHEALLGSFGRSYQWSEILRHLSPSLVLQNEERWPRGTSFEHDWHRQYVMILLLPTLTHSRLPRGCIHCHRTLGMVTWSQCPKRQIILLRGCSVGALHLLQWFLHGAGIIGISRWSLWCPVHGWPKESALPDLGLSTVYTTVSPIWCHMTFLNDSYSFGYGYTSS